MQQRDRVWFFEAESYGKDLERKIDDRIRAYTRTPIEVVSISMACLPHSGQVMAMVAYRLPEHEEKKAESGGGVL